MIFINEDKAIQKTCRVGAVVKYKGKMSNNLLVIEDVFDFAKKNPDNHGCICKCLKCGMIYPRIIPIRKIREKTIDCTCTGSDKRYRFLDKREKMLYFLVSERNKAASEAVFLEDMKRVEGFDMLIHFIKSKSLATYFRKGLDMRLPE